jgi:hypothetical protein
MDRERRPAVRRLDNLTLNPDQRAQHAHQLTLVVVVQSQRAIGRTQPAMRAQIAAVNEQLESATGPCYCRVAP